MIAQGINHEKLQYLLDTVRTGLRCYFSSSMLKKHNGRDQARGRLGRNILPRGRNFALNRTQGEVGVSLKKKKKGVRALRGYFGPPMRSKNKSLSSQVSLC